MYRIKQLSIFVENKTGELTDITTLLSKNNISILSINLVDSGDFGLFRIIVQDDKKAKEILDEEGFSLKITDVFAIGIENHVGSFNEVISILSKNNINVLYTYTASNIQKGAFIFRVELNDFDKAIEILKQANVKLLQNI